ncbi:hypothetical protein [Streptomyces sp. M54]|uniref:hypothetical protein n=1 Tax=Streptomyces sp. M54 TaxID=2759525 RepID=UPI001A8C1C19|nr:hypothetical protein [Streptomyces sp. M54]QSS95539.1 hypothetical protein H3V39_34395 [Streptomyces sp. M54]
MADLILIQLSPKHLERLKQLTDASRLRTALYPAREPRPVRRRSRQYPGGRPTWHAPRLRRRYIR